MTARPRPRPGVALLLFWGASLSVGLAAFVALAFLSHGSDTGVLADASAVLSVSFVLAVVPGAVQLRAAADAAEDRAVDAVEAVGANSAIDATAVVGATGDRSVDTPDRRPAPAAPPTRLVAALTAVLLVASPAAAALLTAPWLSLVLLVAQLPVACLAAVQRGTAIGREEYGRASLSMGVDAGCRLVAGTGLGVAFGATGLAVALLAGTVAAVVAGHGWYARGSAAAASAITGPAVGVGILMVLVNLDVLAAPRVLGAAAADAYAIAELPAKGVFFALFAISWVAVPIAARSRRAGELLQPVGLVGGLGIAATLSLVVFRPLLPLVLGDPAPSLWLLTSLALAMTAAATLATVLAMAVARSAPRPWVPSLATAMLLGAVIVSTQPTAPELAGLVLAAQLLALGGTTLLLLRTLDGPARSTVAPLLAARQ